LYSPKIAEDSESRKPRLENQAAVWNVRTSSARKCLEGVLWALEVGFEVGRHEEPHLQCHVLSSRREWKPSLNVISLGVDDGEVLRAVELKQAQP
jgi:hypothetical protein